MQQGDTIGITNRTQEPNVAARTKKYDDQVNTTESVLASAEVLETIEVVPFHEDFIH